MPIEKARAEVLLQAQHLAVTTPRGVMYHNYWDGGMNHTHAYAIATVALVDQVDRALSAPANSADHRAIAAAIAGTMYRLGYRGDAPLEWLPWHLKEKHLREVNMIEAYLLAKMRRNDIRG